MGTPHRLPQLDDRGGDEGERGDPEEQERHPPAEPLGQRTAEEGTGEALLDPLRVELRKRTPVVHPADVTVSALGDRGGVIGAAFLARDGWEPES